MAMAVFCHFFNIIVDGGRISSDNICLVLSTERGTSLSGIIKNHENWLHLSKERKRATLQR